MRLRPRPTLRWLDSLSPSPSPSSSAPPSPSLTSLHEALNEPLIRRPPRAHLSRQPPLFSNIVRSTLPTASPAHSLSAPPPISVYSTSTLSSLDTLRSLSTQQPRPLSTQQPRPLSTSPAWWSPAFDSAPPLPPSPTLLRKCTHSSYSPWPYTSSVTDRSPKNPIVFCHGLLGFDSVTIGPAIAPFQVAHWRGITEALMANGTEVLITRVPATSSPADRAKVLEQKVSQVYPGRSVHLIGTYDLLPILSCVSPPILTGHSMVCILPSGKLPPRANSI